MKFSFIALATALCSSPVDSFLTSGPSVASRNAEQSMLFAEDPGALTSYMAKAHEDKLRAMKEVEAKKNVEIEALKKEMAELKQGSGGALVAPAANMNIADMSKEEMAQKLVAYQNFMAKYIVEAQQQKAMAVQAAEAALKQKYEGLLAPSADTPSKPAKIETPKESQLYQERSEKVSAAAKAGKSRWGDMENERAAQASSASLSAPVDNKVNGIQVNGVVAPAVSDRSLFDKRNVMVAAAGKAGKSRWGDMEVKKASSEAAALPSASTSSPAPVSSAPKIEVPPEVAAADHGLRNDGGVGGPSLADRINLGAQLLSGSPAPVADTPVPAAPVEAVAGHSLFDKRNVMVAAAGKAGKSRWGDMEIQKVQTLVAALPSAGTAPAAPVAAVAVVPPEVEEADHGLRADGGVGGPSLAQRVNLGASLLQP